MVKMEDAVIARLDIENESFEILIDPEAAQKFKEGEEVDLIGSLAIDTIFKDSKKGDKASEEKINKTFGTDYSIPVLFFTQALGLALGGDPRELGMNRALIPFQAREQSAERVA